MKDAPETSVVPLLPHICAVVKKATGHDFSRYKESTLARRVSRRITSLRLGGPADYLAYLEKNPRETQDLFNDLLIGVTHFFRDPEAFEALAEKVIPILFKRSAGAGPIRVWVSGCATGEEAYSIAILLAEERERVGLPISAQVFATDLDTEALATARKALYPASALERVSPERAQKYFLETTGSFEVRKDVREMCIFSPHNLVKDPPFSRLDLISCRNLLIYFESDLQKRALPLFHFALNPAGFLFLGPSENVAIRSELFQPLDQKNRLFQRKSALLKTSVHPLPTDRSTATFVHPLQPLPNPPSKEQLMTRTIERVLLEEYAPASVVINEQGETVFFCGHTGRFLEHQAGAPTRRLVDMARGDLRLELRAAVQRALATRQEVARPNLKFSQGNIEQRIDLTVRPLFELGRDAGLFIVVFQETPNRAAPASAAAAELISESELALMQQLESELRSTREDLQATVEELETSNEELKSANEELLSMNEELQSTNEELQTSKEEVQSANDELQRKMDDLDAAHNDLQNFFENTHVATLFLDRKQKIQKFTPALSEICSLNDRDVGKDFVRTAGVGIGEDVRGDIEEVLRSGEARERQLARTDRGKWFLMRIAPYRGVDQSTQGVVITFPDITAIKRNQEQSALMAAIVDSSNDAIIGKTLDGIITSWNPAATKLYGYTATEAIGKPISMLIPPKRLPELHALYDRIRKGEMIKSFETERVTRDGKTLAISLTLSPIRDSRGELIGVSGIERDVTETHLAQERQARLAAIVDSSDDAIIGKTLEGIVTSWNNGAKRIFGFTAEEMVGHSIMAIIPPDKREEELGILRKLREGNRIEHYETTRLRKDGRPVEIALTSSPVRGADGSIIGASKIARDITAQKQAQAALLDAQNKLRHHAEWLEEEVAQRTLNLQQTVESLEGVCYTIAHDLRAPLRAVQSFTQVLLEDYRDKFDAEGREFALRIVNAASRMDRLINDLLAYAKLSHGQLPTAPLDLNEELKRTLEQLGQDIKQTGAQVTIQPLPTVLGNQTVVSQIFVNLISNALKFVPPGAKAKIEVGAERNGEDKARIYVQDNGIGIPEEHLERVFGLFQRLHHDEYPGTGVGLAIVKKGVERMGGEVTVSSKPGAGTRFVIELPVPE